MKKLLKNQNFQSILWAVLLFVIWETVARAGLVNQYLMPPFTSVVRQLVSEVFSGNLGVQTLNSLHVIFIGFALSFVLSVVITALCSRFRLAESLFNTLSTIMNPLPSVAIMPLVIMWFGIDVVAMYVLIIHGVLWALVRHLLDGYRAISQLQLEFGRNIGLTPLRLFSGVVVFAILPELIAGLRTGWGRAWRAMISAEMVFGMIGNVGGVGFYISRSRAIGRINDVYVGIIIIALIGVVAEVVVFDQIEKSTTRKWGMLRE
jgi:NitT/TauT family transport system permease protein